MNRGRLVALEGLDGCGKSTQLAALADALRSAGRDVLETCEPTDGPSGRRIREMARSGRALAPEEELRLFVEDRREHVAQVIEPGLAAGRLILTDRYFVSTVAYQGARGLDPETILADSEAEFPVPDLVVLLEIDAGAGLERVRARGGEPETVFERLDFLERVAAILASLDRPYIERIDARRPAAEVAGDVRRCLEVHLGLS